MESCTHCFQEKISKAGLGVLCMPRVMWAPGRHVNVLSWLPNVVEVCMTVDEPAPANSSKKRLGKT
eukprot:4302432-Amphidinium_carterae.1